MGRGAGQRLDATAAKPRRMTRIPGRDLPDRDSRYRRVLSIDGGGIRGIIPAMALAEIEERTGKPTAELFDLIAGTSTGAIIALALTVPGEDGKPRWSARELVELYEREGPEIFRRSLLRKLITAGGVLGSKYSDKKLDEALKRYLGDAELKDALTDVLVPVYETERREPFFFRSGRARENPAKNFKMRDVVRAAVAAPTYFKPVEVRNEISGNTYSLIDGGVFANNPGMCAWADAHVERPGERHHDDVMVLSLGTGSQTKPLPHEQIRGWGLRGWAPNVLDVVFDGVSNTTDYQLWELLGDERYLRLQTELTKASDKLDRANQHNIELLKQEAREMLEEREEQLGRFLHRLLADKRGDAAGGQAQDRPWRRRTRRLQRTPAIKRTGR